MFCRNQTSRATVARGSAVEMEVRRGHFRLSVFEDSAQDSEVQKQIEMEVRVREGACRLLAACSQREQALEASKSLLTCNSRILALMSQLQRMKEAQALQRTGRRSSAGGSLDERKPGTGKVAISDIRIPLMWKDSEYFKNKGELHRWAVFCLLTVGREIYDTDLVMVDRTHTDICFEDTLIFADVSPGFELRLELYSCYVDEEFSLAQAPRRLARLSGSLGRSSGKRLRAALESATACGLNGSTDREADGDRAASPGGSPVHAPALGPKYHLLAHTCLTLSHVQNSFRTHDLTISGTEDSSFWLPLYGSVCCRLVAQPNCMTLPVMSGKLKVQQPEDCPESWSEVYAVLKGTGLICYHRQEDVETEEPAFTIPINKETRIRAMEKDPALNTQSILITNQWVQGESTHMLITHTHQDTHSWMEAFWQHFYDMSQWKQCCDELMKIEAPSPRKPVSLPLKQGSLYHDIVPPSGTHSKDNAVPQSSPVSSEIQTLLSSYYNDRY
ncbi:rhotekin 2b isoform X2 [Colossoma macropomum]|uniref:rhotekin 2b isoform X2 n=1 Tax=Colossoma macropomum TaxID=42526 RepID=UPI0018655AD8|nr:rhotekin 2b isoform X2 [Colossoma macropomum]